MQNDLKNSAAGAVVRALLVAGRRRELGHEQEPDDAAAFGGPRGQRRRHSREPPASGDTAPCRMTGATPHPSCTYGNLPELAWQHR